MSYQLCTGGVYRCPCCLANWVFVVHSDRQWGSEVMSCPSGQIVRGKLSLQTGGRLVRLLRSCDLSRASCPTASAGVSCCAHQSSQFARKPAARHTSFLSQDRRPNRWGCKLISTCQVAASSPRTAAVESAETKSSKQQGKLVTLPTTDESPQLDRIRHSVSTDPQRLQPTAFCIHSSWCCLSAMVYNKAQQAA